MIFHSQYHGKVIQNSMVPVTTNQINAAEIVISDLRTSGPPSVFDRASMGPKSSMSREKMGCFSSQKAFLDIEDIVKMLRFHRNW
jgi:hypothetical protein